MNISILIPSRNGLEFLQWSYNSIRKNQGNHDVEILILDDYSDKDNTKEWLQDQLLSDPNLKVFFNEGPDRHGISGGYKFLVNHATRDVICHWHNDMYMTEGTLDVVERSLHTLVVASVDGSGDYFEPCLNRVVCLTRIEPPIYNPGPEKIIWKDGPIELEDWNEDKFSEYLPIAAKEWGNKTTEGHFAPFFMFREEYMKLGGNDIETFPLQSREDSDWAFRLVLAGFRTIQIPRFTYHFASRGNRRSKYETDSFNDNPAWTAHNIKASRNFIRKWQTFNLHDEYLKPNKPVRYNIGFVLKNGSSNLLYNLEPWCDQIEIDLHSDILDRYIEFEQLDTKFNLKDKINNTQKIPDIVVQIDGNILMKEDWNNIRNLSDIITNSCDGPGDYELGNLKLNVRELKHYENELIVCKNEY